MNDRDLDVTLSSDSAARHRSDSASLISEFTRWRQRCGFLSLLAAAPALAAGGIENILPPKVSTASDGGAAPGVGRGSPRRGKFFARRDNHFLPHQQQETNIFAAYTGNDDCPGAQIPNGVYTAASPFTDTGDTTGANNTISTVYCYYCFYLTLASNGPDHVYTFTITSTGANPEIRVTPNSGSYNPLIYILGEANTSDPCPAAPVTGTVNVRDIVNERGAGEAETFGGDRVRFLPLNVPLHLFIDSVSSTANPAGAYTLRMQDVSIVDGPRTRFDFDRDGDADISVFRPSNGTWYTSGGSAGSAGPFSAVQFGISTDQIVPADYDGDGKTDVAVFRDGTWYWINSSNSSMQALQFGSSGDIPQPGDFDGDGRSEIAVYRNGTWYTYNLRTGEFVAQPFGIAGDKPVVGDYDGDGRADYAVYRNGTWFLQRSLRGFLAVPFGLPNDVPVPARYTFARNRTDLAVFRNGTWHVLRLFGDTPNNWFRFQFPFGQPGDTPVPGDYIGLGHDQPTVVRDGIWYIGDSFDARVRAVQPFGLSGDRPAPAAFIQR